MDAKMESGKDPVSKVLGTRRFRQNERVVAGGDGRTRPARPDSHGRRARGNIHVPSSVDDKQDSLLNVIAIHNILTTDRHTKYSGISPSPPFSSTVLSRSKFSTFS